MLISRANQAISQPIVSQSALRLGLINYVNSLPFVLPILQGHLKIDARIFLNQPAGLNALYVNQELDLGMMSLFSFLRQGNLKLMPDISVSSQGAVGSVLFFSKLPIDSKKPLNISVPADSATAVNLLLLLLLEDGKQKPVLTVSQKPDIRQPNLDAVLIIGDQALLVDEEWSKHYLRYDLGQWWYDLYKLPAVFAVFAARQNWYETNRGKENEPLFEQINETLLRASRLGLADYFPAVLDEAQARTGLSLIRLERYFKQELDYSLNAEHMSAINKYQQLCQKYDLLR